MGASASRQTLLPAEEVQEGPYELKSLRYTYLISNPSQSVEWLLMRHFAQDLNSS